LKAIIDLGTNTFHLFISEVKNGTLREYFKLQVPVKIGLGGINNGIITEDAYKRGITAVSEFKKYLDQFRIDDVTAFATSAIRNAKNGDEFVTDVKNQCGIDIVTIDGDTEADYIYKGVSNSFKLPDANVLVMDIGGGSVEFIIGRQKSVLWKQSFEIGAARLIDSYHKQDPISEEEIAGLNKYLDEKLGELRAAVNEFKAEILIGAAGSFETLLDVVIKDLTVIPVSLSKNAYQIRREDFDVFLEIMQTSTADQRSRLRGMTNFRVEMITVAALLMNYVITRFNIKRIIASDYSLKEGVMFS
jgi:exopolyphosphatase / guanosine-5'-triphosphate,3'-diphosphate pyrophosphatase